MKKAYSTPDIFFDSFALSENIASVNTNCSRNITTQYSNIQDGSPYFDGLCYHTPTDYK